MNKDLNRLAACLRTLAFRQFTTNADVRRMADYALNAILGNHVEARIIAADSIAVQLSGGHLYVLVPIGMDQAYRDDKVGTLSNVAYIASHVHDFMNGQLVFDDASLCRAEAAQSAVLDIAIELGHFLLSEDQMYIRFKHPRGLRGLSSDYVYWR